MIGWRVLVMTIAEVPWCTWRQPPTVESRSSPLLELTKTVERQGFCSNSRQQSNWDNCLWGNPLSAVAAALTILHAHPNPWTSPSGSAIEFDPNLPAALQCIVGASEYAQSVSVCQGCLISIPPLFFRVTPLLLVSLGSLLLGVGALVLPSSDRWLSGRCIDV